MNEMLRKIDFRLSVKIMILLLLFATSYHLLIVFELMPYEAVWGGRLESREQMLQFESVSITINLFMLLVILIKGSYIKNSIPVLVVNIFLWIFTALFAVNTVGNIFSLSLLEATIFTPITLVSAVLCLRLAIEK